MLQLHLFAPFISALSSLSALGALGALFSTHTKAILYNHLQPEKEFKILNLYLNEPQCP